MKKTYELNYGNKATINTGNYENLSPMFNIKTIVETNGEAIDIKAEFETMKKLVEEQLNQAIQEVKDKEKLKLLTNVRFYERDGKKYPSVTSIISMGEKLDIPNIDLYSLRGELLHKIPSQYIKEGVLYTKIEEDLKKKLLPIGGIDEHLKYLSYITEDERMVFKNSEVEVFNDEHLYAGRYDADGTFDKEISFVDFKSGELNKNRTEEAFMQLAAYAKCHNDVKTIVIYPINHKSKKEPIVTNDIDKYFSLFLVKREEFKKKFGI